MRADIYYGLFMGKQRAAATPPLTIILQDIFRFPQGIIPGVPRLE